VATIKIPPMGRPPSPNPKSDQVNVRLTEAQAEALAAIEFLDELSAPELFRALLDAEFVRRQRDPLFVEALRLRREARLRREGRLIRLPSVHEGS